MVKLDLVQLTRRLVDIESVTFKEAAVGTFLFSFLEQRGFQVEKMAVEGGAEPDFSSPSGGHGAERFNVSTWSASSSSV